MMNLHYGDARNKNNSSGQNKLNKFTSNTYASSLINYTSTFPTLTSSLNSNMVASDGLKPSVASWSPSPNENLLISERIINNTRTWTVVGANGHASFSAEKPKLLSKSPAPTERPLKKLTSPTKGESKENINFLRERFNKFNKTFMNFNLKDQDKPDKPKYKSTYHGLHPTNFINTNNNTTKDNNNNHNNNKTKIKIIILRTYYHDKYESLQ